MFGPQCRRDEGRVDVERADRRPQPVRELPAFESGVRDAGTVRSCSVAARMIRDADDREPEAVGFQHDGRARPLDVRSRSDDADAGGVEVRERVEERVGAEVERVVVGERHAVDAEVDERPRRPRRCSEVKDRSRRRSAAGGDAAFEVEDDEVRTADDLDELRREQRIRTDGLESLRDAATEHRVAGERELHVVV